MINTTSYLKYLKYFQSVSPIIYFWQCEEETRLMYKTIFSLLVFFAYIMYFGNKQLNASA